MSSATSKRCAMLAKRVHADTYQVSLEYHDQLLALLQDNPGVQLVSISYEDCTEEDVNQELDSMGDASVDKAAASS